MGSKRKNRSRKDQSKKQRRKGGPPLDCTPLADSSVICGPEPRPNADQSSTPNEAADRAVANEAKPGLSSEVIAARVRVAEVVAPHARDIILAILLGLTVLLATILSRPLLGADFDSGLSDALDKVENASPFESTPTSQGQERSSISEADPPLGTDAPAACGGGETAAAEARDSRGSDLPSWTLAALLFFIQTLVSSVLSWRAAARAVARAAISGAPTLKSS